MRDSILALETFEHFLFLTKKIFRKMLFNIAEIGVRALAFYEMEIK